MSNATLLHYATYEGKEEIVKLLIEYGAFIEKDIYVELLVKHGSIELIKYILNRIKLTYEQYKNILRTALFVDDKKANTNTASELGLQIWNLQVGKEDVIDLYKKGFPLQ